MSLRVSQRAGRERPAEPAGDGREEAITWTKRFLAVAGDGEAGLRLMHDEPAAAPADVVQVSAAAR
jgi:hypothetical protein